MKKPPVGFCDVCGNYAYRMDEVGRDCQAHHQGSVCSGRVVDASAEDAWEACPACQKDAQASAVDCPQCAGAGWLPR